MASKELISRNLFFQSIFLKIFTFELIELRQGASDSPRGAGAAELIRRACGRTHLVRTIAAVILVVAHPVGWDAAASGAGKFRVQTGGRQRWASHALTPPHTILAGTEYTQKNKISFRECSATFTRKKRG